MPGTLHLVATPIGNLEDITLRALRVLREVSLVVAEDTRRTAKLLTHFGISTSVLSYHEHNAHGRMPRILGRLHLEDDVAIVTDAGTPGISDPGAELVQACVEAGIPVNPVPGVSAPLAAAIVSGFPLVPLTFYGFAPHRSKDRNEWLAMIGETQHTFCFFEAPTRIAATIGQMGELWPSRQVLVARELTKVHQQLVRGTPAEARAQLTVQRGEFTIVVAPAVSVDTPAEAVPDSDVVAMFRRLTENGAVSRRDAIAAVARACHKPSREVYAAVERAKTSVE